MTACTLIETVADLTAERDRDALEGSLAHLLRAQLDARTVTFHRLVPDVDGPRLCTTLRVTRDGVQRLADPAPEPARLTGSRERCVAERSALRVSSLNDPSCSYLFPVLDQRDAVGLIEADGVDALLEPEAERSVANLLRIYRHHLASVA